MEWEGSGVRVLQRAGDDREKVRKVGNWVEVERLEVVADLHEKSRDLRWVDDDNERL